MAFGCEEIGAYARNDARTLWPMFAAVRSKFAAFSPLPNCFELYGVDFPIDQDYNPYLLLLENQLRAGFSSSLVMYSTITRLQSIWHSRVQH